MGNSLPSTVAKEIKERVFLEADKVNYLSQARQTNMQFINQLVNMPEVGSRLANYMPKSKVRTYIKDGILNRYSKDKIREKAPEELEKIISSVLGITPVHFVEKDNAFQVQLFKSGNKMIVVAHGTLLKWETALRKALLYIASKPFSNNSGFEINILLSLFARHQKVSPADHAQLCKAVSICHGYLYIFGEE